MSGHGQCSLPETRPSDHRGAQEGKHARRRDTRCAMQGKEDWEEEKIGTRLAPVSLYISFFAIAGTHIVRKREKRTGSSLVSLEHIPCKFCLSNSCISQEIKALRNAAKLPLRPRPQYAAGIISKRRSHSKNASCLPFTLRRGNSKTQQ